MTYTFKRSNHTQRFVVFGPEADLQRDVGKVVEVVRRDGQIVLKRLRQVSKPFDVDGVPHAVASIPEADVCPSCRESEVPRDGSITCPTCALRDLGLLKD